MKPTYYCIKDIEASMTTGQFAKAMWPRTVFSSALITRPEQKSQSLLISDKASAAAAATKAAIDESLDPNRFIKLAAC